MPATELRHQGRPMRIKKATTEPDFLGRTVLVGDPWDYVDPWLRRRGEDTARFYWEQSRNFSTVAMNLPATSAPLLSYYAMLNAAKALLTVRKTIFKEEHGVGGDRDDAKKSLNAERVTLTGRGVFGAFAGLVDAPVVSKETYSLKQLLYNLVWIHRAFTLTYRSQPELFFPVRNITFVQKENSPDCWVQMTIQARDKRSLRQKNLPAGYEWDGGDPTGLRIRRKKRFSWQAGQTTLNLSALRDYHKEVRSVVSYIRSAQWLWYVKRTTASSDVINRQSTVLSFAAMHRLSELARYKPQGLVRHLEAPHNWLLNEFISIAVQQFIDEIAAEITGLDFMLPGIKQ